MQQPIFWNITRLSGYDPYLHPVQCFPLLLIFPRFLVSAFLRFRISVFPCFLVSSFPCFLVSLFRLRFFSRSVSHLGLRFVSRSVPRFGFRSVSRSVTRFGFRSVCTGSSVSRIGFCSTILDSRPTPIPVPIPDSVSILPSSRQRLPLLLALLPHGVALYRRQRLITDSHSARPRQVRSCGSRPCPVTLCYVSG